MHHYPPLYVPVGAERAGTQLFDGGDHLRHRVGKHLALAGADPAQPDAVFVQSGRFSVSFRIATRRRAL